MSEWLGIGVAVVVVGGLLWLTMRLLRRVQGGDPSKRGRDASEPGGFYDAASGGPD